MAAPGVAVRRVYEPATDEDGVRVLVDRLWPRGLSKEKAAVDLWLKDIAPSDGLRRWFSHDPDKWDEFRKRYLAELSANSGPVDELARLVAEGHVTLLFAARDEARNNAVVLMQYISKRRGRKKAMAG